MNRDLPEAIHPRRLRLATSAPLHPERDFVLYWMTSQRRLSWNWALDRAMCWARQLQKPLLVFEPLGVEYPWASERFHTFAIEGMREHAAALAGTPVGYFPWVGRGKGDGEGLLRALSQSAALVVTDAADHFIYPGLLRGARSALDVRLEAIDSAGIVPVEEAGRAFNTAHAFRRWLQSNLSGHLLDKPEAAPAFSDLPTFPGISPEITERWIAADPESLLAPDGLSTHEIDHRVRSVSSGTPGGAAEAHRRLQRFLETSVARYGDRNQPDSTATSGLSAHLHWGHISAHQVVARVLESENWTLNRIGLRRDGAREGWWGVSAPAEAFLDQIVTWRELGLNGVRFIEGAASWDSLPEWARRTLEEHAADPRAHDYSTEELAASKTHDEIWNAAQRELRETGFIQNYLRMLWGKKILKWSPTPRAALDTLFELNDRFALDGRDPNSLTGIMWTLGRYDRGWPEREIYGKIRCMTSASTRRKLRLDKYLDRFGTTPRLALHN